MKDILFITWDGPNTNYMEGLFMPIFNKIMALQPEWRFHVIQFSWADHNKVSQVQQSANHLGIIYTHYPIFKKPIPSIGSMMTLWLGSGKINRYLKKHKISILMPRSTFPAYMVRRLKRKKYKIIFDADGLPIDERVDFAGLDKDSWLYQWLKGIEKDMLLHANHILTRSIRAIDIHTQNIGISQTPKFSVVKNGRDTQVFNIDPQMRQEIRQSLGFKDEERVFVYCGSLGAQYCWEEMMAIFTAYREDNPAKFLVITGNQDYALERIPEILKPDIIVLRLPFTEVPKYLNAADVGFGLRMPSYSMQGVAPIKLGEYLLCGLPVIASKGIGDTELILKDNPDCYIYNHALELHEQILVIKAFIKNSTFADKDKIRDHALEHFSLVAAANTYIKAINKIK